MKNCDIGNCKNIAKMIIDDHGVDTFLCDDHYCEWKAVETHLKYSLEKYKKLHGEDPV